MTSQGPLFLIPVLTGIIFIIADFIQLRFPPKKINNLYEYRTTRSMKIQEVWDLAQIYSSKLSIEVGTYSGSFRVNRIDIQT